MCHTKVPCVIPKYHVSYQSTVCHTKVPCVIPNTMCHTKVPCVIPKYHVWSQSTVCHTKVLCVIPKYRVSYQSTVCHTKVPCVIPKFRVSYQTYRLVCSYGTPKSLLVGTVTCNSPIWKHSEMYVEHFTSLYLKKLQACHTALTQNPCFSSFATHGWCKLCLCNSTLVHCIQ
jgi:hypothetical protein